MWENCLKHEFDNMICLCPNCHRLHHQDKIDRQDLYVYKRNLAKLTGRYCDFELRILTYFAENGNIPCIDLPVGLDILVLNLLKDGLLSRGGAKYIQSSPRPNVVSYTPTAAQYVLTPKGREYVQRWVSAK